PATMQDLLRRNDEISGATFMQSHEPNEEHVSLLYEKLLILDTLHQRHLSHLTPSLNKKNLFFAFCSADRTIAKSICLDLCELGHEAWFYEADSTGGAPFIAQMNAGIEDANAMVVVISRSSLSSKAVRLEWTTGVTKSLADPTFVVVPVIVEDCELPAILSAFSFADVRDDYWAGVGQTARLLAAHSAEPEL
ncbi:MAG: toll/interleukin-1 receptor domain-containing protein, partial [Terricaulis sp.]